MRFHEVPKRAQFSVGLELGDGFVVGVKGFVSLTHFYPEVLTRLVDTASLPNKKKGLTSISWTSGIGCKSPVRKQFILMRYVCPSHSPHSCPDSNIGTTSRDRQKWNPIRVGSWC